MIDLHSHDILNATLVMTYQMIHWYSQQVTKSSMIYQTINQYFCSNLMTYQQLYHLQNHTSVFAGYQMVHQYSQLTKW